jgi:hypothetical protein
MSYATLAEFHSFSNLISVSDDPSIQKLLDAADRQINRFCNRPDGFVALAAATARHYSGHGDSYEIIDECVEVAQVAVKDSPTEVAYTVWTKPTTNFSGDGDWLSFRGDPVSPDFSNLPITGIMCDPVAGAYSVFTDGRFQGLRGFRREGPSMRGVPTVRITAKWGYAVAVPADIRTACCMQALRWYKRLQGAMTTSLASSDLGEVQLYSKLDPDVAVFLRDGRYLRPMIR